MIWPAPLKTPCENDYQKKNHMQYVLLHHTIFKILFINESTQHNSMNIISAWLNIWPTCAVLKELYCSKLMAMMTSQELRGRPAHFSHGSLASRWTGCCTVFALVASMYALILQAQRADLVSYLCFKFTFSNETPDAIPYPYITGIRHGNWKIQIVPTNLFVTDWFTSVKSLLNNKTVE